MRDDFRQWFDQERKLPAAPGTAADGCIEHPKSDPALPGFRQISRRFSNCWIRWPRDDHDCSKTKAFVDELARRVRDRCDHVPDDLVRDRKVKHASEPKVFLNVHDDAVGKVTRTRTHSMRLRVRRSRRSRPCIQFWRAAKKTRLDAEPPVAQPPQVRNRLSDDSDEEVESRASVWKIRRFGTSEIRKNKLARRQKQDAVLGESAVSKEISINRTSRTIVFVSCEMEKRGRVIMCRACDTYYIFGFDIYFYPSIFFMHKTYFYMCTASIHLLFELSIASLILL